MAIHLNVEDCLSIRCMIFIFCPALNGYFVCLIKVPVKSLLEIPSIVLFARPSCRCFKEFIFAVCRVKMKGQPLLIEKHLKNHWVLTGS